MFRCSFLFIYSRGLPITVNRALNNLDSPGLYISSQCLVSDFQSMFMGLTLIMDIPPALANSLECQLAHGSHVQCPVYTWIIHCDIIETKICYNYVEGILCQSLYSQGHWLPTQMDFTPDSICLYRYYELTCLCHNIAKIYKWQAYNLNNSIIF